MSRSPSSQSAERLICGKYYSKKSEKFVENFFFVKIKRGSASYLINADFFSKFKEKKSYWLVHVDDLRNFWVTAFSSFSQGVSEFILKSPFKFYLNEQMLTMMDYFSENGLNHIPENKFGIVMHFDSTEKPYQKFPGEYFHLYNMGLLTSERKPLTPQLNAFSDYLDFALEGYSKRFKINENDKMTLKDISKKFQSRSFLLFSAKEPSIDYRDEFETGIIMYDKKTYRDWKVPEDNIPRSTLPDHYNFRAGLIAVYSENPKDLLPMEEFSDFSGPSFRLPRSSGVIVEIGRFYVDKLSRDAYSSNSLFGLLGSIFMNTKINNKKVDKIVIEVDVARFEIFKKFGFQSINKRVNFLGREEHIMEGHPEEILAAIKSTLIEKLKIENMERVKYFPTSLYRPQEFEVSTIPSSAVNPQNVHSPKKLFYRFNFIFNGELLNSGYEVSTSALNSGEKRKKLFEILKKADQPWNRVFINAEDPYLDELDLAFHQGTSEVFEVLRKVAEERLSQEEYYRYYQVVSLINKFKILDMQATIYNDKFQILFKMLKLMNEDKNFWSYLQGDHGIWYTLLDYYLNADSEYLPSAALKKSAERNRFKDLNIYSFELPEAPKNLSNFFKEMFFNQTSNKNFDELIHQLKEILKKDKYLYKINAYELLEFWMEQINKVQTVDSEAFFKSFFIYNFWSYILVQSEYISEVKFKLNKE